MGGSRERKKGSAASFEIYTETKRRIIDPRYRIKNKIEGEKCRELLSRKKDVSLSTRKKGRPTRRGGRKDDVRWPA